MNKYKYAASANAFYATALEYPNLPDDAVDIDESAYIEFAANPAPEGKMRVAGADGLPEWADISAPDSAIITARNSRLRTQYTTTAALAITTLQAGIDTNRSVDGDSDLLTAWQNYLCDLRVVDLTQPAWPETPTIPV